MSQYKTEKAVFVGVVLEKGGERKVQEYLDELQFLAETAGAIGDKMFMQRMDRPDKATYIGTGKLQDNREDTINNFEVVKSLESIKEMLIEVKEML